MPWLNVETNFYSVGDQQLGQIEVPERKNPTDTWVNGAWVLDTAAAWKAYQAKAQAALSANDAVAIRCAKAAVAYPAEWQTYDLALRTIIRSASGDPTQPLPIKPAYPAGT